MNTIKCKNKQLYDPINKKCLKITSKKGNKLQEFIKICNNYSNYNLNCKEINKYYPIDYRTKLYNKFNILIYPFLGIIIYNLIVVGLLLNNRTRTKLIKVLINTIPSSKPYAPLFNDFIYLFPSILNFVNNYYKLASFLVGYYSLDNIVYIVSSMLRKYSIIKDTTVKVNKFSEGLKDILIKEMPGNYEPTPLEFSNKKQTPEKIENFLKSSPKTSYFHILSETDLLPGSFI